MLESPRGLQPEAPVCVCVCVCVRVYEEEENEEEKKDDVRRKMERGGEWGRNAETRDCKHKVSMTRRVAFIATSTRKDLRTHLIDVDAPKVNSFRVV